jgi:hypothetical protein
LYSSLSRVNRDNIWLRKERELVSEAV